MVNLLEVWWSSFVEFFPNLLGAVILLLLGLFIGKIVGGVVKRLLIKLRVDRLVFAARAVRLSDIFSTIIRWVIYLAFIWAAVETLGIVALTEIMRGIVLQFLPGILWGIVILVVGYVVAEYVKNLVEKSRVTYSEIVSKAVFWLILYVAIAAALPKFGIDPTLVNNILLIIVASAGAGMAIALGLGLKDIVRESAQRYLRKRRRK